MNYSESATVRRSPETERKALSGGAVSSGASFSMLLHEAVNSAALLHCLIALSWLHDSFLSAASLSGRHPVIEWPQTVQALSERHSGRRRSPNACARVRHGLL